MSAQFDTGLPGPGQLQLQCCGNCQAVNYPPRELCGSCLADSLSWRAVDERGSVLSQTDLHYSLEPNYATQVPWTIAVIKLDCGPVLFAHLQPGVSSGVIVSVKIAQDQHGSQMLIAVPSEKNASASTATWLKSIKFKEDIS